MTYAPRVPEEGAALPTSTPGLTTTYFTTWLTDILTRTPISSTQALDVTTGRPLVM